MKALQPSRKQRPPLHASAGLRLRSWATGFSLGQPIRPADWRAWNRFLGEGGGKHCVQHAQHLQEVLLVINLSLQQLLQTQQLSVHDWWLADYRPVDIQDHLGRCYKNRSKPGVNQVPGKETEKVINYGISYKILRCSNTRQRFVKPVWLLKFCAAHTTRKLSSWETPCSSRPARVFFSVPLRSSSFITATAISGFRCLDHVCE